MTTGRTQESGHFGLVISPSSNDTYCYHDCSPFPLSLHPTWPLKRPTSTFPPSLSSPIHSKPSRSSSFARRKAFAIKHQEAEPLTRRDLQYDFLYHIFAAPERVFTDPTLPLPAKEDGGGGMVTFRDLYVHALMSSPRCSKALREKMQETPEFATDFAKMSLLANVGRVNTTMTCLSSRLVMPFTIL